MSKLEELKAEKEKAMKAWVEASNILYKTPEYQADFKAMKAWKEARAKLREETK
jgi:hypothetical protein